MQQCTKVDISQLFISQVRDISQTSRSEGEGDFEWGLETLGAVMSYYHQGSALSVTNTGASWLVKLPAEGSSLTGGAIPGQFKVKIAK